MSWFKLIRYVPLSVLRGLAKSAAWTINQRPEKSMLWKTRVNLKLAYPELNAEQREKMARESVTKQCMAYIESAKCWAMPPEWSIQQIKTVHNIEALQRAFADENRGVFIITPHLGTWEMMNAWVHQFGTPTIMYKPIKNKEINDFVLHARQRLKAELVPTDATGVKALFKTLKQGGFSVILPDHVPHASGGIIASFFNVPCLTSTLASKMAQKTKCHLIGLSCFRREDGEGFDVYCDELNHPELYDANIEVATTALNHAIEDMINRFPTDYMWGYKRFRGVTEVENAYHNLSVI